MKTLTDIRTEFLSFFEGQGHAAVSSSPLVPHNDPTLMFTNAGMNQFKNVFTGLEQLDYKRATSSQKCVRAGGKHNDLENVGYTARHHTFFEMLGNFSFGDYFKEDAIKFAWDLLTKTFGLPAEKLGVTVYHTDDEAFNIWKKVSGFSDDKILRIPTSDNFWAMGDTGPCGPCSEIFYDHGTGEGKWALDKDGHDLFDERFVEIWNLVFMQHEKHADGSQTDLPKPSIDTGMGLERMTAVMQGVHDNYDIDLFKNLIEASEHLTNGGDKISHRVIADHLRSSSFLIADGVMPSNEGRGYVLRRIMRRAMRHAHQLGAKDALMYRLVPALIAEMGEAYPELSTAKSLIEQTLKSEEERFRETLGRGLKLLDEAKGEMSSDTLSGDVAFKLYDTYGFPLDLTADILRREDKKVDEKGFESEMQKQRERAKAAWKGSGEQADNEVWFEIKDKHGATEFTGYTASVGQGKVLAVVGEGDMVEIITNQTPFYAESGGQVGDSGTLSGLEVVDTKKRVGEIHSHICKNNGKLPKIGDVVELKINSERRNKVKANHSATHLLHAVLRNTLGDHVTQKGSLVEADYLRFDFSHNESLSAEQLQAIDLKV
ncbi:MAG: alanine--tRNA ligase, partial [Alphaproteobacteria bacterium CG11_big_fil_rev_8_21_14_0_20_44_7]